MNFKTTIVLVVVLLAIGAALWMFGPAGKEDTHPLPEQPPQAEKTAPIFDPPPNGDSIVRVEIDRPEKPRMIFERIVGDEKEAARGTPETWRMVEPLTAAIEPNAVRGLITNLTGVQSRGHFEPGAAGEPTAAEAGLEPPAATVALVDKADRKYALEIGKQAVMSNDTYVRVVGAGTVHIANRDLLPQVRKDADEYRSKRLVDLKLDEAVGVRIEHEGKTYSFSRGADGEWVIDQPLRTYADREKVRGLITKFNTLRAEEFVEDAPASLTSYGLQPPLMTFAVTCEAKRQLPAPESQTSEAETQPAEPRYETVTATHSLAMGGFADIKSEKRYVQPGDQRWVVAVKDADVKGLIPNLKELRDPRVTRVKAADVTRFEITTGDSSATLEKVGGVWQSGGDLAQIETAAVTDLLEAFEDLRAIDYVDDAGGTVKLDPAAYGLDRPRAVITVTATGSVEPLSLRIGSDTASGKNAYVQRGQEPTVIVTSAAQAARLAVSVLSLRSREVFNFPAERLQQVQVERPAMRYELLSSEGQWKLAQPPDAPLDLSSIRALTADLSRLRGSKVVGKGNDAEFGLDRPLTTIRFDLAAAAPATPEASPAEQHALYVGRKDNVAYARRDDDQYIFELDDTVYRVLTAELIDPRLFTFKPDDVIGVKVVSTGGTLELIKDAQKWKYTPDPFVELNQKTVQDFIKEITEFRAEAFFAYRDGDVAGEGLLSPPASLSIHLSDGREIVVNMTQERAGELPRKAALIAEGRIFRMRQADVDKLFRGLDAYLKTEQPAQPDQPQKIPSQSPTPYGD